MKTNNKSFLRSFSTGFIAFMCTLLLVSLTVLFIIQTTLFSPLFLEKSAGKANYYHNLTTQITRQVQDFGLASSIPEKVLAHSVSEEMVKNDFNSYLNQAFKGIDMPITNEEFIPMVEKPIYDYAKKQGQTITPEIKNGIDNFSKESFSAYKKFIKLPELPKFGQRIQLFANQLTFVKVVLFCSLVLLLVGLIYLVHQWWHRVFRYAAFITGGAGLMLTVFPGYIYFSKMIGKIALDSKSVYLLLTTYLNDFILRFIYVGVVCLVLAVLFAILSEFVRRNA